MSEFEFPTGPGQALPAALLRWKLEPSRLGFTTTEDVPELERVIGQDRAVEALGFGLGMERHGYNIFALGPDGTGKHTIVRRHLDEAAGERTVPDDWCYVSNFKSEREPRALRLPAGRGRQLKADMTRFTHDLGDALRSAFESDEYRARRQVIEEELKERQEQAVSEVEEMAKERGVALIRTQMGFGFAPMSNGRVIQPEIFQQFPEAERERVQKDVQQLEKELQQRLQQMPMWVKEVRDQLRALNEEVAGQAVGGLIDALMENYRGLDEVVAFLEDVRADVVENVEAITTTQHQQEQQPGGRALSAELDNGGPILRRYRVNLVVDNAECRAAPVIYEDDPAYDRMFGRIDHRAEMGALLTDLHLIRPGSMHRANGGYLMLDARKVLTRPMAWEALKRALMAREIRIEPMYQALGLMSTVTLEPETMPLDVKVVLIGERMLYYLLAAADPEFIRLFKVAADFDDRIERTEDATEAYGRLMATIQRREGLKPLDAEAAALVIEESARRTGDSERLSGEVEALDDMLREADYWAGERGVGVIAAEDVRRSLAAEERRLDRIRERVQEEIRRGTVAIATAGETTGQINGLSVMQIGGFSFGRPTRITARVRMGRGEVVDVEREVELGGPLHTKGVLILTGFLASRYAREHPLSLSASLVFEQSYGGVDGDSASSAELYALLSAISEVPIRQGFAVTGSVDQYGRVQAIGGVNEKIEGFFDLCAARGLTGDQGVLVPATNVKNLMLAERVVEAVDAGRFRIHAVETIDQGIEILTGVPAGDRGDDGLFPVGSVNRRVEDRLIGLANRRRSLVRSLDGGNGEGESRS